MCKMECKQTEVWEQLNLSEKKVHDMILCESDEKYPQFSHMVLYSIASVYVVLLTEQILLIWTLLV